MPERIASLISGGGSTMHEIVSATQSGELLMDIACVIASNPKAPGIEKAKALGLPDKNIVIVNPREYRDESGKVNQERFGKKLLSILEEHGATVVTQNGWMHLTPSPVLEAFSGKIFNQHPGPVPEFGGQGMYGMRVHAARLLFAQEVGRDMWTEAIVQRVATAYDEGAVVQSGRIQILSTDTPEDLQRRVLPVEHRLQIALLKEVANGTIKEIPPRPSLVRLGEEEILKTAKQTAIRLYPRG
jgi:phosphoribosylglycinamide formyltransferase 1